MSGLIRGAIFAIFRLKMPFEAAMTSLAQRLLARVDKAAAAVMFVARIDFAATRPVCRHGLLGEIFAACAVTAASLRTLMRVKIMLFAGPVDLAGFIAGEIISMRGMR